RYCRRSGRYAGRERVWTRGCPRNGASRLGLIGIWSHEHQQHQSIGAGVLYAMLAAGRRQDGGFGRELLPLAIHGEGSFALENDVYLVGALVRMQLLYLAGFEAVEIGEAMVGLEQPNLLHAIRGEFSRLPKGHRPHSCSFSERGHPPW